MFWYGDVVWISLSITVGVVELDLFIVPPARGVVVGDDEDDDDGCDDCGGIALPLFVMFWSDLGIVFVDDKVDDDAPVVVVAAVEEFEEDDDDLVDDEFWFFLLFPLRPPFFPLAMG